MSTRRTLSLFLIAATLALLALLVAFNVAHLNGSYRGDARYAAHVLIAVDLAAALIAACSAHLLLGRRR